MLGTETGDERFDDRLGDPERGGPGRAPRRCTGRRSTNWHDRPDRARAARSAARSTCWRRSPPGSSPSSSTGIDRLHAAEPLLRAGAVAGRGRARCSAPTRPTARSVRGAAAGLPGRTWTPGPTSRAKVWPPASPRRALVVDRSDRPDRAPAGARRRGTPPPWRAAPDDPDARRADRSTSSATS